MLSLFHIISLRLSFHILRHFPCLNPASQIWYHEETRRMLVNCHLHMWVGNVFSHVCLCVCSGYNFWTPSHRNFFLVYRYIFTISRSSFECQGQGHMTKKANFTYFNMLFLCMWLQVIDKVKVTSRSYDKKANFTYFNMLFLCMWLQVIDKVKVTSRSK